MKTLVAWLVCLAAIAQALDNGLGRTPQMGWNSWNHFSCHINDQIVRNTADAFVAKGLDKHGYKYVNIDDCWAGSRDSNGNVVPDPKTFPDMPALASYVHSKGLLFGLYSDAGTMTCQKRPGSLDHETSDANSYAKWGVDYLKYDSCNSGSTKPEVRYTAMRDALNKTGRPIFFSMCDAGDHPEKWAPEVGNSWRVTTDIRDYWDSMISKADASNNQWRNAGPGGWNDADMLEIGNGGMSTTEWQTHFSLWCLLKSPLLIGCDVTNMSDDALKILTNDEVIAVNQDKLGFQGNKTKIMGTSEIWAGPLSDGSKAVILLNRGNNTASITAEWSDIGWDNSAKAVVRDLWAHKDMGIMTGKVTASVPSHGVAMYTIKPQK